MGFTVRLILGTVLVLLCSWSIEGAQLKRPIRQTSNNGTKTELQKVQVENATQQSTVANLTEDTKPKTDISTEANASLDKENSVVGKLQKSESYKKATEIARSIDIDKYVSDDFHNKNNVYSVSTSPDTRKYLDSDFAYSATTHKHADFSQEFDYHSELTTPKSSFFDAKFKEAVESVDQKLEHIDDSHEILAESESKDINLEKLYEETKKNDTEADLNFINYKNIISNDTGSKNSLHKDLVVENGTNLNFRSSFNHTTVIDEDDDGNNTIAKEPEEKKVETSTLSNLIPVKGDLDKAESSTSKNVILTTRKSNTITKPPSNKNSSHISILSNNIETETVKAINPVHLSVAATTEKGETESGSEILLPRTSIGVAKRPYFFNDFQTTESSVDSNHIHKKQEQLQQENQIVPVHVEPPFFMKNRTTVAPLHEQPDSDEDSVESVIPMTMEENPTTESFLKVRTTEKMVPRKLAESPRTEAPSKVKTAAMESVESVKKTSQAKESFSEIEETDSQTTESASKIETTIKDQVTRPNQTSIGVEPSKEEISEEFPEPDEEIKVESTTQLSAESETKATSKHDVVPEPETTTEMQTEQPTTRLLDIITTICPPKLETTTTKPEVTTSSWSATEVETVTSIVTETSVSPWVMSTTEATETETKTISSSEYEVDVTEKAETTTFAGTYLSDSTDATTVATESPTTMEESTTAEPAATTEAVVNKISESDLKTTEDSVRTSKGMVYKEVTTPVISATTPQITEEVTTVEIVTTEQPVVSTTPKVEIMDETTQGKVEEPETTTIFVPVTQPPVLPDFKSVNPTESSEVTTDNNSITSDFYEHTDPPEDNSGTIAAITISSIGAVCLILLAGLLVIMRKRQKRFNYGQRCRPVSLDDYSMDNASVYNNSVRRKAMLRGSKRSYGNPAFEDPASISHPLNFPALGKFASNLEDIKAEFEEIPQITARTNELPEGCDTKNRYANIIPLPETRVFLSLIDGYPNSDYINANYVTGPKNTKGYYIACQAPMQNTVDDFWRMVWEQQSKVILMLTHLFENGVEKCVDYLPPSEVLDCHRLFGDFQVTLKKREVKDKYIISSLQLKNMVSNSWREVTHFWYLGWPEKGVPAEANSLIAFLIEARSYMKSSSLDRKDVTNGNLTNGMTKNETNPVVVHCSPGTGRTGVVIACDIAIREFEQTRLVDVPRIVYKIRRDRASAVQTKDQYAFIYKVINLYATKLTGGALDSL